MARVRSTRYPELYVADLGVKFSGGVADVRGKAKLDALASMDGIEIDGKADDGAATGTDGSGQSDDGAAGSGDGDQGDAANSSTE